MGPKSKKNRLSRAEFLAKLVNLLKQRSVCLRDQQAAAVLDFDMRAIHSMGYNGPAAGEDDSTACKDKVGACGCVHAEANALIKLSTHETGLIMVCTTSPCEPCAKLIVNSKKIKRVAYLKEYRDTAGVTLLVHLGIDTGRLEIIDGEWGIKFARVSETGGAFYITYVK